MTVSIAASLSFERGPVGVYLTPTNGRQPSTRHRASDTDPIDVRRTGGSVR